MQEPTTTQETNVARQYIDDTTSMAYAEAQDQEWLREEQQHWYEDFRTEMDLYATVPAMPDQFRMLAEDIPF
jgi:hypothetical protein